MYYNQKSLLSAVLLLSRRLNIASKNMADEAIPRLHYIKIESFELPSNVNRRIIANCFSILIARWRIFYKPIVTIIRNTDIYCTKRK